MINDIEESKLSKSRHIRVQPISGAKVDDIRDNLDIVINDDLKTVVLQIGTNDSTTNSAQDIFNNIMSLKKDIESMLPNGKVVISKLIKRKDNSDANQINEEVDQLINVENVIQIDNNNINENHLGKRGLHLNDKGNAILAGNILNKLRDLYWYDFDELDKFCKPQTKSVNVGNIQGRNINSDLQGLIEIKNKFPNNLMIGYLNLNIWSPRNFM